LFRKEKAHAAWEVLRERGFVLEKKINPSHVTEA